MKQRHLLFWCLLVTAVGTILWCPSPKKPEAGPSIPTRQRAADGATSFPLEARPNIAPPGPVAVDGWFPLWEPAERRSLTPSQRESLETLKVSTEPRFAEAFNAPSAPPALFTSPPQSAKPATAPRPSAPGGFSSGRGPLFAPSGANGRITQAEVDALEQGLDQTLAELERNLLAQVFAETLPLVGDGFRVAWTNNVPGLRYLTTLRTAAVTGLATLTGQADYSPSAVASAINAKLTGAGFAAGSLVAASTLNDEAQLSFTTSDTFGAGNVPLAEDLGLANLNLKLTGTNNAQTTTGWTFQFNVGVDGSGFYLETPSASFSVRTTNTIANLNAAGQFARLPYRITDNNTSASTRTVVPLNFALQLKDPNQDGRLRLPELAGSPDLLDATVTGNTRLALKLVSSVSAEAMLPQIGTDLELTWNFAGALVAPNEPNTAFGSRPQLTLKNNRMNLDSFFNSFAGRALRQIETTTAPLQPVIDVLTEEIPLLSDLGSDQVTVLDLFGVSPETVDAIGGLNALFNLADLASSFSGNNNVFSDLGDYSLASGDLRVDKLDDIVGAQTRPPSSQRDADLNAFMTAAGPIRGLSFPLLTDGSVVAQLLLGRNATLFSYRSGEIGFQEELGPLFFPVLGPVGVTLGGHIGMTTEFGFGYDAQGIFDFSAGGGLNTDLLRNGFYAMALDEAGEPLTGIELEFGVTAGLEANVVVASAGVEGDLTATVGIHLDDQLGDEQGRLRGNLLSSLPLDQLFYAAGSLSAALRAYLEVGLPPFSIAFDFESPRVVLLSFDSRDSVVPILAEPDPTDSTRLLLNVGDRAPRRIHGDNDDRAEEFFIGNTDTGGLRIFAFNEQMDFPLPARIVGDANLRGDVLTAAADMNVPVHFRGGPGMDHLTGGGGDDDLEGGEGPDRLSGRSGDDHLRGGPDNDELNGGLGSDILDGGEGLDTASWVGSTIPVFIDLRVPSFGGAAVGDTLISIERYEGTSLDDILDGSDNSDSLLAGSAGNDLIRGHGGSDQLEGGEGADTLEGGPDNDLLIGGPGADHLDGGEGIDIVAYLGAETPVTVSLLTGLGTRGDALGDVLTNFEILMGSGLPKELGPILTSGDILEGSDQSDTIYGMDGADEIRGAGGDDVLYGNHPEATGSLRPGYDADRIFGGPGNDRLYGQTDDDQLDGGEGVDMLDGGEGDDHLITTDLANPDFLDGGPGINRLSADYSDKSERLVFIVGNTNSYTFADGDTFTNIQTLGTLSAGNAGDIIRLASRQEPSFYSKTIHAGLGDDLVIADWRGRYSLGGQNLVRTSDHVDGGPGNDTLSFEQSIGGVTANLATGGLDGAAAGMSMTGFENLIGTRFTDTLTGDAGPNILAPIATLPHQDGVGLNDYVDGGDGVDILRIDFSILPEVNALGVSMDPNTGTGYEAISLGPTPSILNVTALVYHFRIERFEIVGGVAADKLYGESISFGATNYNDRFWGLGGDDIIQGNLGDDYLDGGEGNDTLFAGVGNDTVLGGPGNDAISFAGSPFGQDIVEAGLGDDSVSEILTPGADTTAASAADILQFDGGDGFDTLRVDVGHMTSAFVFDENHPPAEINLPNGGYLRNFEHILAVTTGSGNDVLNLPGRFNNQIALRGGNDTINPGLGVDTVSPGTGIDRVILDYSVGDDDDTTGVIYNSSGSFHQRRRISSGALLDQINVANFERIHITGTSKNDVLQGASGDDILLGGAGSDTLTGSNGQDWLDGGPGADTLTGGFGNDTYVVDDPGDTIVETSTQNTDTVRASIDFTLPANVEHLVLTGNATVGTGNTLANFITGNSRNNILLGGGGADTLNGGGGPQEIDRLNGGPQADTFVLGDGNQRYYDDGSPSTPGLSGYAIIEDFTPSQNDRLALAGSASEYFLGVSPIPGIPGTALYHDSDGNSILEPASDELIAVLVSPEVLTAANTIGSAKLNTAVDPAVIGLQTPLRPRVVDDGSGPAFEVAFSIADPVPAGVVLEIQTSTDLGFSDPWQTIASKTGPAAWTGPAPVSVSTPTDGRVTVTVHNLLPMAQQAQQFFRLRLSKP